MSNSTYVCFTCRTTERVPQSRITRTCRKCRRPAEHVYYKFKIPKKDDDAGWDELRRKVRPFNRTVKANALASLEKERVKLERILSTLQGDKQNKRRSIEAKLSINKRQIVAWQQWDQ